jgi:hypothetical protein
LHYYFNIYINLGTTKVGTNVTKMHFILRPNFIASRVNVPSDPGQRTITS